MNIELTPELQQAVDSANGTPAEVIDPRTQTRYLLVKADVYARLTPAPLPPPVPGEPVYHEIAPGTLRAMAALRRDLPELLANPRTKGKHVCYHLEQRLGISKDYLALVHDCYDRGLPRDEWIVATIEYGAGEVEGDL